MPAPTRGSERAYRFVKIAECVAGVDALELSKDVLFVQARASGRHAVIKPALARHISGTSVSNSWNCLVDANALLAPWAAVEDDGWDQALAWHASLRQLACKWCVLECKCWMCGRAQPLLCASQDHSKKDVNFQFRQFCVPPCTARQSTSSMVNKTDNCRKAFGLNLFGEC